MLLLTTDRVVFVSRENPGLPLVELTLASIGEAAAQKKLRLASGVDLVSAVLRLTSKSGRTLHWLFDPELIMMLDMLRHPDAEARPSTAFHRLAVRLGHLPNCTLDSA